MEALVKLNSTRVGRDKIFRALQYALKAANNCQQTSQTSKDLEKTIGSFRKLLRLGTFIDALLSARQSITHPDLFTRVTVTLSRIAIAMYLFGDHIVWLHNNNVINVADVKRWQSFSDKSWLYSIVLNLVRDYKALKACKSRTVPPALMVDTVSNILDFWLPYSALGHVNMHPGLTGALGVMSSVLSALPLIKPDYFKF